MKSFLLLASLIPSIAFAAFPKPEAIRDELNQTPYGEHVQLGTQLQSKKVHILQALYDFNRQGGALGTLNLLDAKDLKKAVIPAGAIIKGCAIHVLTPPTSAGSSTLRFSTGDKQDDLKGTTAKASLATSDGLLACDVTSSVATWKKIPGFTDQYSPSYTFGYGFTREYTPTLTIGAFALDGGKLNVWIEYILNR